MFLGLPFDNPEVLQRTALILNTVLLIATFVVVELLSIDAPASKRRQLRLFYPIVVVLVGLFVFAAYQQGSA